MNNRMEMSKGKKYRAPEIGASAFSPYAFTTATSVEDAAASAIA
jgi:hypothetical protein